MKRLLFQAVFLATGMIMGVYASGDVGLDLMCGALVAVCCAAVGEYASGSWLAMALIVMLDCGACLVPAWYLMLPIAAFNAASSSAGVDGSRFLQALVPRWLWLLPMTIVIFRSIGSHVPSDLSIIILMVLQTVLGFAAGLHDGSGQHVADIVMDLTCDARAFGKRRRAYGQRTILVVFGDLRAQAANLVAAGILQSPHFAGEVRAARAKQTGS